VSDFFEERSLGNMARFYRAQLISIHRGQRIHRNDLKNLKKLHFICLNSHGSSAHFELTDLAKRFLGVT
jgi:hypothetical protein